MTDRLSRRDLICRAAVDLAAGGGNHAVTHQAIDARLGLPRGSTSYYYRTRKALLDATITHLTDRSRVDFTGVVPPEPPRTPEVAADAIARYLAMLVTQRRVDVLARYALVSDAMEENDLRVGLASCLFSVDAARDLMDGLGAADPEAAARDLVSLCEGLAFDLTCGHRSLGDIDPRRDLEGAVRRWIVALLEPR